MPDGGIIAWLASLAANITFAVTGSVGVSAAVGNFIMVYGARLMVMAALTTASNAYSRQQMKKALRSLNANLDTSRNITVREATGTRKLLYGKMRIGGTVIFMGSSGATNEFLHLIAAHIGGESESFEKYYLNDEELTIDGSGNCTSPAKYANLVRVKTHLGSPTQTHDTDLAAACPTWTSNHRLRGVTYSYWRFTHNTEAFSNGLPNVSVELKGRQVYDPRSATTVWSDNPALCLRDYLTDSSIGLGATSDEVNDTAVITAANICDELVNLNPSGTEKRYLVNGIIDTAGEPAGIISELLTGMAGICPYINGKFTMKAGAHTAPILSLGENDLRGAISVNTGDSMSSSFNGVKGIYVSASNGYQNCDFPPVTNATYKTEDGGITVWKDILLPFTNSSATAQRMAKIELERGRQDISVIFPCKLTALNVTVGDVITLTFARYGWTDKMFEIIEWGFAVSESGGVPTLGIDLMLRSTTSAVWDWSSTEQIIVDAAPAVTLPDFDTVATPGALTLSTSNFVQTDGTISPRMRVQWTAPTNAFILTGGFTQIEYKKAADATWLVWNPALRGDAVEDYITDVQTAVSYNARIRWVNIRGVQGAYSATATFTVTADTTAPATPTGFLAIAGPGAVVLDWNDNTEDDLDAYELYRATSNSFGASVLAWTGFASQHPDYGADIGGLTIAANYYYWLKAVDTSGNKSAATASVFAAPNSAAGSPGAPGVNGTNGTNASTVALAFLYQRASSAPAQPASTLTFTFSTGALTGTFGSWSQNIPAGTAPLYVVAATASSTGSSDTITGAEWSTAVILAENGAAGSNGSNGTNGSAGLNVASVLIYQRASSSPSVPGSTLTYTFSSGALSGSLGSWTQYIPTVNGNPCWTSIATASSTSASDTITSGEWTGVTKLVEDGAAGSPGAPGAPGANGTNGTNGTSPTFTLTLTKSGGYPDALTGAGTYASGTTVNIVAPNPDSAAYTFLQWSGGWPDIDRVQNANSSNTYVTMTGNTSLTADY